LLYIWAIFHLEYIASIYYTIITARETAAKREVGTHKISTVARFNERRNR